MDISKCERILIVGDSGRGKSTLASNLSKILEIEHYELDNIFWIKKFTEKRTKDEMLRLVLKILDDNDRWIIEGSTRSMISLCLESSDCIIHLRFRNIFAQWFNVIKRGFRRRDSIGETVTLCIHLLKKRYGLGHSKGKKSVKEILSPYESKVIEISSYKDIDELLS